jgi:hypothetical protein
MIGMPSNCAPARTRSIGPVDASAKRPRASKESRPTSENPAFRMPAPDGKFSGAWMIQKRPALADFASRIALRSRG